MLKVRRNILLYLKTLILYVALLALLPCPTINKDPDQEGELDLSIKSISTKTTPLVPVGKPNYDYSRMISLIEQCRQIKKEFYNSSFQPSNIDTIMTENIITELKKERFALLDHINDNKIFFQNRIPTKKRKALRYYSQILVKYIILLKAITQKQQIRDHKII